MKLLSTLKSDLPAGIVVFLVALPLCLGIAMASGAPLISGFISGIVAGVVVSLLSGSEVSVSGPAAGLTIIVATGIVAAGSFEIFLFAVLLAGCIQLVFGFLKIGTLASLFPNSVISGMLSAIGIIIFLKQIPHAVGNYNDYEGDENFYQFTDQENTFSEIVKSAGDIHYGVLIMTLACLAILMLWTSKPLAKYSFFKLLPGSLVAVLMGVTLNEFFSIYAPSLSIGQAKEFLVQLPVPQSATDLFSFLSFPDLTLEKLPIVLSLAITIAIVASIETLLSVEAADKIDPFRRVSDPNKELIAQGTGNILCGLLGGLPITAVIVRSTANVYAGSRSRFSSFYHGMLLLISLIGFAHFLNKIPLASLAAILLVLGFKLASPKTFRQMYHRGLDQFIPFIVTVVIIIFTDLLSGVFAGLVASMFFVVRANSQAAITFVNEQNQYFIRFSKDMSFANKKRLRKILFSIPNDTEVLIDGTSALFIDQDIIEELDSFKADAKHRNIKVEIQNMKSKNFKISRKETDRVHGASQKITAS